jgi:hypothetical protein
MGTVDEGLIGMSFVCETDEDNINITQNNIIGIINFNLEREQKDALLENKINELKNIFEKQSLDINHKNVQILCKALLDCKADLKLSDKEFEDVVNYSKQRYGEGELLTLLNSHKEKRATYRYERPGAVVLDASIGIASMTLGDGARAK